MHALPILGRAACALAMAHLPRAQLPTTHTAPDALAAVTGACAAVGADTCAMDTEIRGDAAGTLAPAAGEAHAQDEQSYAFALIGAMAVDGGSAVQGGAWRDSRLVRNSYWHCTGGCDLAYLKSRIDKCPRCGVESSAARAQAAAVVATRQAEVMEASSYGRRLSFGRDTAQAVGVPVSVGRFQDPEYSSLVQAAIDNVGADVGPRQRRGWVPEGVKDFDAYLAIVTRGTLKVITRADVHAFMESGRAAELLAEFETCMGSVTSVGQQVCMIARLNLRGDSWSDQARRCTRAIARTAGCASA